MIHLDEDPFAVPVEAREPARRLRGRLVSPVTAWTTTTEDGRAAGITVGSILVAEGEPPAVLGLIDPLSEFWGALAHTRTFVVHVLARGDRRLADQLAGRYPGPDAKFENLELGQSAWGPVLRGVTTRAYCTLTGFEEVGDAILVTGSIDEMDLTEDASDPLAYFRGAYRDVIPRRRGPAS